MITADEKQLLSFCHKVRNNLYHKGDEEKLLTQVAIIILHDIIKKYQPKWKSGRMFLSYHLKTVDPYKIKENNLFRSSRNSEQDWNTFLEKYFKVIDGRNKSASRLISDFLILKITEAKESYKFAQTEFDIFFPHTKNWRFNEFILHYSFLKVYENDLERIKFIEDKIERRNQVQNLQENYLKSWRFKKEERLDILKKAFEKLPDLPIERCLEKFISFREETFLFYDALNEAARDLDNAIQNAIDKARDK